MNQVSFEEVKTLMQNNDWEITDEWEPGNESGRWSITSSIDVDGDSVRVAIDEPNEEIELNNIFIESPPIKISTIDEYEDAVEISDNTDHVWIQVRSEDGVFEKAKHSVELEDMSDKEILELVFEKDVGVGIQFVIAESTRETELEEVPVLLTSMKEAMNQF